MSEIILGSKRCFIFVGKNAERLLIQPVDEHDLELLEKEVEIIKDSTDKEFTLAAFLVEDWNRELSPWEAPAMFGSEGFGSGAEETLSFMTDSLIPYMKEACGESREYYLGGYSLAGLFALWAGYRSDIFTEVAGVSPSVWFPRWDSFIEENSMKALRTYLSLGDREPRTRNPVMAAVGDRIELQYAALTNDRVLEWNKGNHFMDSDKRTARGFAWLLERG